MYENEGDLAMITGCGAFCGSVGIKIHTFLILKLEEYQALLITVFPSIAGSTENNAKSPQ